MPHIHIEYSGNLETAVDMQGLCTCLREVAAGIETFPMPGIRVRATRVDHFSMADGDPKHAFVDISIRLRAGREPAVKHAASQAIFDAARIFLEHYMKEHSLALSLEMRDIDPDLSPKTGTVRAHLAS